MVQVNIAGNDMIALLDPGSNTTILTHDAARKIPKAKSRFARERVKLAGNPEEEQETCIYTFPWVIQGKTRMIQALVMDQITDTYGPVDINPAYELFPQYSPPELDRPQGCKVDILIGLDYNDLLAAGGQGQDQVDNLRVMSTPLTGHHPSIRGTGPRLSEAAMIHSKAVFLDSRDLTLRGTRSVNMVRCNAVSTAIVETDTSIMEVEAEPEGNILASEQGGDCGLSLPFCSRSPLRNSRTLPRAHHPPPQKNPSSPGA